MTSHITVVGGGIAGLTAAVAGAEAGARVTLHEAHQTLGGRAQSTTSMFSEPREARTRQFLQRIIDAGRM